MTKRRLNLSLLVEIFALGNIAFLGFDIYIAHAVNAFSHPAEWIPLVFSILATFVLLGELVSSMRSSATWTPRTPGMVVGAFAVLVGVVGLFLHLDGQFFQNVSLRSMVYTAPLAAPLAYAGVGFLLMLNRMVVRESLDWARWVVFLTFGGFIGLFVLAVLDHAQNGFFYWTEWVPVVTSAYGMAFLGVTMLDARNRSLQISTLVILGVSVLVGLAGFVFHLSRNLDGSSVSAWDNFVYGAPIFAPLLMPNLAFLGGLGIVGLRWGRDEAVG